MSFRGNPDRLNAQKYKTEVHKVKNLAQTQPCARREYRRPPSRTPVLHPYPFL